MRQRLSSEPDRYRGRRRVPTPPRSRYAVVGAAAFVGAGVVALGTANMPDAKDLNPTVLRDLESSKIADDIQSRNDDARADRSDRGESTDAPTTLSEADAEKNAWMLPLEEFQFTQPFGVRLGKLHAGIDLAAPEGTVYQAVHGGEVTSAGYNGGYGYQVTIKHDDGSEMIYAHSRRLLVKTGDIVKAGQPIGQVGNTGYSYGTHLHLEMHVGGEPVDPIPALRDHGVDIKLKMQSIYGATAS